MPKKYLLGLARQSYLQVCETLYHTASAWQKVISASPNWNELKQQKYEDVSQQHQRTCFGKGNLL
jgi:hypothetical protein